MKKSSTLHSLLRRAGNSASVFLVATSLLFLLAGNSVMAQSVKAAAGVQKNDVASVPENLTLGLRELVQAYLAAQPSKASTSTLNDSQFQNVMATNPLARSDSKNRVIVDVYLDGKTTLDEAIANCESMGGSVVAKLDWYRNGVFSAWIPLDQAVKLATSDGTSVVQLSLKPKHNVGKCTAQGNVVEKAEAIQNTTGYFGASGPGGAAITIGALSDSYSKLKTTGTGTGSAPLYPVDLAPQDVASGDLPGPGNPLGNIQPVNVVKDFTSSTGVEDEGRGMLQIIHDMVPKANLAFYTADVSEVDFAAGIIALKNAGCNIVCDDVGYFDEPMFSDGPVGQAIDQVAAAGVSYFSSAGNDDCAGYTSDFHPVTNNAASQAILVSQGVTYTGLSAGEQTAITDFHSFGTASNGDPILVQNIRIPGTSANATGHMAFQWDDPYNLVVGGVKQVTTDYDILVFSAAGAIQTTRSGMTNNITGNTPLELPSTLNAATSYKVVIARTNRSTAVGAGVTPNQATHLRYTVDTNDTPIHGDFLTPANSNTHGHNDAAGCSGVAAYRYDSSPVPDVHDPTHVINTVVEAFSSNGPVAKYFDAAGNRLATPVVRKQPVLAGVDGVDTSFFPPVGVTSGTTPGPTPGPGNPSANDANGDNYPNFFGTSAAAPNAAAVAAIVLDAAQANGKTLSPADVRTLLTTTTQTLTDDADPNITNAVAGPVTITATGFGRADNHFFTVKFNGTAGQTLSAISIDLSKVLIHFDTTFAIPTDTSTTATATGVVVSTFNGTTGTPAPSVASFTVGTGSDATANSLLTVNFNNFNPGSTLSFGVGRRNDVTNIYGYMTDPIGRTNTLSGPKSATISATVTSDAGSPYAGPFVNQYQRKWNYKTGYGLIDAQAAVNKLLAP